MKVITIANQKGGVGKTTTALNVGAQLENRGYKVLYIDLDKQCNLSKTLRADIEQPGVYKILADKTQAKALVQVTSINANVISSSKNLDILKDSLNSSIGKEYRLKESLKSIDGYFDFVILDTPPNLDIVTVNALTSTDYLIVVTNTDSFNLDGVKDLFNIVSAVKEYTNKDLKIGGLLIQRYNNRSKLSRDLKERLTALADELETKVYKTLIRESVAVKESQALRLRLSDYDAKCNANKDFTELTDELLKDIDL